MRPAILAIPAWLLATACSATVANSAGSARDGGAAGGAPRLIAPLSTAWVTGTLGALTLRWAPPAGGGTVTVSVCADRGCTVDVQRWQVASGETVTPTSLPPGVHFWRVEGATGTSATWELFVSSGRPGAAVVARWLGDLDGDGRADVALADLPPGEDTVRVFAGPALAAGAVLRVPIATAPGETTAMPVGDLDGDGYAELLVTAHRVDGSAWRAWVFHGGAGGPAVPPVATLDLAGEGLGEPVGAGDIDGDGYGDLAVAETSRAAIEVYHGGPQGIGTPAGGAPGGRVERWSAPEASVEGSRTAVACAGDVDGDGRADLAVHQGVWHPGAVPWVQGERAWLRVAGAWQRVVTPVGETFIDRVAAVEPVGDLNGDGVADLVVESAPDHDARGAVSVTPWRGWLLPGLHGGGASVDDPAPGSSYVPSLHGAGDLDADGYDDLSLVGYQGTTVQVIHGGPGALGALGALGAGRVTVLALPAGYAADGHGSPGDVDGDGVADLVVRARTHREGASDGTVRSVYVYAGGRGGPAATPVASVVRGP